MTPIFLLVLRSGSVYCCFCVWQQQPPFFPIHITSNFPPLSSSFHITSQNFTCICAILMNIILLLLEWKSSLCNNAFLLPMFTALLRPDIYLFTFYIYAYILCFVSVYWKTFIIQLYLSLFHSRCLGLPLVSAVVWNCN